MNIPEMVELLGEYEPDRAAEVNRLLAAPSVRPTLVIAAPPARDVRTVADGLAGAGLEPAPLGAAAAVVLLWIFDAGGPDPDEWRLLRAHAATAGTVLLTMTGTDRHREWRAARTDLSARLAAELPWLATQPIHPIAPQLVGRAMAGHRLRPLLEQRSGMAALVAAVRAEVDDRAGRTGERCALRLLHRGLDAAVARQRERRRRSATVAAATALDRRRRREDLIIRRRQVARGGRPALRSAVARARLSIGGELGRRIAALQRAAQQQLDHAGRDARRRLPASVAAAVGQLCDELTRSLAAAITQLLDEVAEPSGVEHADRLRVGLSSALCAPPLRLPERGAARENQVFLLAGASGGVGLGRLALLPAVGLPALWGAALVPVSIGIGVAAAVWLIRAARVAAERARLTRWLAESLAEVRTSLDAALAARLITVEQRVAGAIEESVAPRLGHLDAELAQLDGELRRTESASSAAAAERDRVIAALEAARLDAGQMLTPEAPDDRP